MHKKCEKFPLLDVNNLLDPRERKGGVKEKMGRKREERRRGRGRRNSLTIGRKGP